MWYKPQYLQPILSPLQLVKYGRMLYFVNGDFSITGRDRLTPMPSEDSADGMPFQRSVSDARDLRALARKAAAKKKDFGKMIIYFGCRNSRMDHIYKEELEKCKMSGALDEVYVAFSRDKEVMEKVFTCSL